MSMPWDRHPDDERPRTEAEEREYREGRLRIIMGWQDYAPDGEHYYATLYGLDLDVDIGSGKTPLEAVADLLWRVDGLEDVDPESCDLVWE